MYFGLPPDDAEPVTITRSLEIVCFSVERTVDFGHLEMEEVK